jgi:uncharacterized protein YraI
MKNKFFVAFVAILLMAACTPRMAKKEQPAESPVSKPSFRIWATAYALKDGINVRKGPGVKFSVVTQLEDGDEVRILGNKNGWYKVLLDKNRIGWVQSPFIGPRTLSRSRMASAFNDTVMQAFDATLYIDKNHPYRVIYLETKQPIKKAKRLARKIGRAFQKKVYPGKLTINLIRPGQSKYFAQVVLPAIGLARIPAPLILHGYLKKLVVKGKAVKLVVIVHNPLSRKELLRTARKISAAYSYPFTKSEIVIRLAKTDGTKAPCLLYFVEDEYGENYVFNKCSL